MILSDIFEGSEADVSSSFGDIFSDISQQDLIWNINAQDNSSDSEYSDIFSIHEEEAFIPATDQIINTFEYVTLGNIDTHASDDIIFYKTEYQSRENVISMLQSTLDSIESFKQLNIIPILRIISRNSTNTSMKFDENVQLLDQSKLKLKQIRHSSPRFNTYIAVIQEIISGLKKNIVSTKREIFYKNVELFKTQKIIDEIIEDICCSCFIPRFCLNIVAGSKGLVCGNLLLTLKSGNILDCNNAGTQGVLIPPFESIAEIKTMAKIVIVVEKEASFRKFLSSDLVIKCDFKVILITGKGYPDVCTRQLVKHLSDRVPPLKIYALMDGDPHGFQIFFNYAFGSKNMAFDNYRLACPNIELIGLFPSLWKALKVDMDALLFLRESDRKKGFSLLKHPMMEKTKYLKKELLQLLMMNRKSEIQALDADVIIELVIYPLIRLNDYDMIVNKPQIIV